MTIKLLACLLFSMNLMANFNGPIAHRGASAYAPENTLAAIDLATNMGVKFLEIDIHMTRDGRIVAIHDASIDRTSDGKGEVADLDFTYLRSLDFGSWFSPQFKNEPIPLLSEILAELQTDQTLIIEFKYGGSTYPHIEEKVIDLVAKYQRLDQVILKSFDMDLILKFEQLAPQIPRLYCIFAASNWFTIDDFLRFRSVFSKGKFQYLQVHKYFLTDWLIEASHERGIKVIVWDVHERSQMKKFISQGVDFIETNRADLLLTEDE